MMNAFINHIDFENEEVKTVYNKHKERQFGTYLPIKLFGTGSEGNSIYLKPQKVLIDVGLPYSRYTDYDPMFFYDVNYVIVTHHHGDHLNPSTLLKILEQHPHIKVIMHPYMYEHIKSNRYKPTYKRMLDSNGNVRYKLGKNLKPNKSKPIYEIDEFGDEIIEDLPYKEKFENIQSKIIFATHALDLNTHTGTNFQIIPHTTKHGDILNLAVELHDETMNLHLLYASDLDDLKGGRSFVDYKKIQQHADGLPQEKTFNLLFLEANYDEEIVNAYLDHLDEADPDYRGKHARVMGNMRHISEQDSFEYVNKVLEEDGLFIPLHASSTFGTLFQT